MFKGLLLEELRASLQVRRCPCLLQLPALVMRSPRLAWPGLAWRPFNLSGAFHASEARQWNSIASVKFEGHHICGACSTKANAGGM